MSIAYEVEEIFLKITWLVLIGGETNFPRVSVVVKIIVFARNESKLQFHKIEQADGIIFVL